MQMGDLELSLLDSNPRSSFLELAKDQSCIAVQQLPEDCFKFKLD